MRQQLLDETTQTELLARIDQLEVGPARLLAADLDAHQPRDGEVLAQLRLRMRAKVRGDGQPVDVGELSVLDDGAVSSEVFADWLAAGPTGAEVAQMVSHVSPTSASLNSWARRATDYDRTAAWIALEQTNATNALLRAVGQHGVTGAVGEHMKARAIPGSRQQERDEQVTRLETAHLIAQSGSRGASGERAASEMALALLGTAVGGDVRLACRVIAWAGGRAYGYQNKLRPLFDSAAGKLNESDKAYLADHGLLTKRKKPQGRRRRNR